VYQPNGTKKAAWAEGQQVPIYGIIYSLKDGLVKWLVGLISRWAAGCLPACLALPPLPSPCTGTCLAYNHSAVAAMPCLCCRPALKAPPLILM
jgi:hypothetical protein